MAGEGFLGRWSRLKRDAEVADQPPVPAPPDLAAAASAPEQVAAVAPAGGHRASVAGGDATGERVVRDQLQGRGQLELPSIDSLGKDSDYSMFMRAEVDPSLRMSALKKLFTDPRFNQMDGLDVYIDDYSKPAPMPLAMLKRLNQSRILGLMEEDPEEKRDEQQKRDEQRVDQPAAPDAGAQTDLAADALTDSTTESAAGNSGANPLADAAAAAGHPTSKQPIP